MITINQQIRIHLVSMGMHLVTSNNAMEQWIGNDKAAGLILEDGQYVCACIRIIATGEVILFPSPESILGYTQ